MNHDVYDQDLAVRFQFFTTSCEDSAPRLYARASVVDQYHHVIKIECTRKVGQN